MISVILDQHSNPQRWLCGPVPPPILDWISLDTAGERSGIFRPILLPSAADSFSERMIKAYTSSPRVESDSLMSLIHHLHQYHKPDLVRIGKLYVWVCLDGRQVCWSFWLSHV